jgi:UDP:flavonoid glycosyltransferase YjiC (YdhE family)
MRSGSFLFATWSGGGNVAPAIGLAHALARRGHAVRFLGSPSLEDRITAVGCAFRPWTRVPIVSSGASLEDEAVAFFDMLSGESGARDLLDEVRREDTDALVVDCMLFNALSASELTGLPTAALVHMLYQPWRVGGGIGEACRGLVDETRRALGLPPLSDELLAAQLWDRADAALIATPSELDFTMDPLPANARYVGPLFEPERAEWEWDLPWQPRRPDPLVLVGFSSTYMHQEDALRRTSAALAAAGVRTLVTTGPGLDGFQLDAADGLCVRRWVPHAAVLPDAAVVVTHAGHATVMDALRHSVPMVCMPMGRDQHGTAARVEAVGAGVTVAVDAGLDEIRAAVETVLASDELREGAKRMAGVISGYDNGARAIKEAEGLLQNTAT